MIDWIIDLYSNNNFIAFFFWGPVIFNGAVYPFFVWKRVKNDRASIAKWKKECAECEAREDGRSYRPTLYSENFVTVGSIVKYAFLTFTPVLNALASIFHVAPIAWDYLLDRFGWLLNVKLVNPKEQ